MANSPKQNVNTLRLFLCMTTARRRLFYENQYDKRGNDVTTYWPSCLHPCHENVCVCRSAQWGPKVVSDFSSQVWILTSCSIWLYKRFWLFGLKLNSASSYTSASAQTLADKSHQSPIILLKKCPLPSNAALTSSKYTDSVLNPSSAIFHSTDLQIHLAASAAFSAHNLCACFKLREGTVTLNDWHAWRGVLDFPACTCPLCVLLCRHLLSRLLKLIAAFLALSPPRHSLRAAALSP